jgi:hypothetical protein
MNSRSLDDDRVGAGSRPNPRLDISKGQEKGKAKSVNSELEAELSGGSVASGVLFGLSYLFGRQLDARSTLR